MWTSKSYRLTFNLLLKKLVINTSKAVYTLWYNRSMKMCRICLSPYREELMRAFKAGFPRKQLWEKYKPLIWQNKNLKFESFLQGIYKHEKHKLPQVVVVQSENGAVKKDSQGIAKMMTELYARKLEGLGPEDITTKDYVAVNKLVLDEQKLSLDKNAQMLEFAKIFGIPEVIQPVIEGDMHVELGSTEDTGDQSSCTQ